MLNNLISMVMGGQMQNNPAMQLFNQMMQGKNNKQQFQTLINMAQAKGIDINAKRFSAADLRQLGL